MDAVTIVGHEASGHPGMEDVATLEELFPMLDGNRVKRGYESGDTNDSILYCIQAVELINEIPSVKEIIDGIISQAGEVMARLEGV